MECFMEPIGRPADFFWCLSTQLGGIHKIKTEYFLSLCVGDSVPFIQQRIANDCTFFFFFLLCDELHTRLFKGPLCRILGGFISRMGSKWNSKVCFHVFADTNEPFISTQGAGPPVQSRHDATLQ